MSWKMFNELKIGMYVDGLIIIESSFSNKFSTNNCPSHVGDIVDLDHQVTLYMHKAFGTVGREEGFAPVDDIRKITHVWNMFQTK